MGSLSVEMGSHLRGVCIVVTFFLFFISVSVGSGTTLLFSPKILYIENSQKQLDIFIYEISYVYTENEERQKNCYDLRRCTSDRRCEYTKI